MSENEKNLTIRKYQESDRKEIIDLLIEFQKYLAEIDSKGVVTPYDSRDEPELYLKIMIKECKRRHGKILVAFIDDQIAGFIQYTVDRHEGDDAYNLMHAPGDHGWITELFTDEKFRGQGVAKSLIAKAEKYFKKNNCVNSRINVMTENELALSVYHKLGYENRDIELSKDL